MLDLREAISEAVEANRGYGDRLGGEVSLDSVEGHGAAFHVDLPRAAAEAVGDFGHRC